MNGNRSRTLIILKPDALERGLIGEILQRIEEEEFRISRLKTVDADRALIEAHYHEKQDEDFFDALVDWMADTVIAGIVEGPNAVEAVDQLAGATEPESAAAGTIRGDLADDSYAEADAEGRALHNLIHTAEPADAEEEIVLWFNE